MMLKALLVFAALNVALAGVIAADGQPVPQWQYEAPDDVPDRIPSDRCVRAVFGDRLKEETGHRIEWWDPPVSENTRQWLEWHRDNGLLSLEFCDTDAT